MREAMDAQTRTALIADLRQLCKVHNLPEATRVRCTARGEEQQQEIVCAASKVGLGPQLQLRVFGRTKAVWLEIRGPP